MEYTNTVAECYLKTGNKTVYDMSKGSQLGHDKAEVPWKQLLNVKMVTKVEHFRHGASYFPPFGFVVLGIGGLHKAF